MVTHRPVARPMNTVDAAASTAGAYSYIRLHSPAYIMLYYTGWSKSLCAPDDCSVIVRCTETFWTPYTCTVGYFTRYGLGGPGSNPGGGEVFRTRPDRPWGPPSLLYNGYRVSSGT